MDRLDALRAALRRPSMRLVFALASLAVAAFFALHVWALLVRAGIDEELGSVPMERTPPPEVRGPDGFMELVDRKLRVNLGDPRDVVYEWWSQPRPMDYGTFRGWAVRFKFRAEGGRAPCPCEGTRVAVMTDTWVDSIVTEEDLRLAGGDAADPFLGEPAPGDAAAP